MKACQYLPLIVVRDHPRRKNRFVATCEGFFAFAEGRNDAGRAAAARFFTHRMKAKVPVRDVAVYPNSEDNGATLVGSHCPIANRLGLKSLRKTKASAS